VADPSDTTWIEAGYLILSDAPPPPSERRHLPSRIVTASTCIADSYPDVWALPWVSATPEELRAEQTTRGLDASEVAAIRAWVAEAEERGDFGPPNVFLSLAAAREFARRFLAGVENRRLVGLSLAADIAATFLREVSPSRGYGEIGMWTAVSRDRRLESLADPLGFDVLGVEQGGSLHTYSCNDLVDDYSRRLGVTFNRHGLIDDYRKAVAAAAYTMQDDVGAEPVPWYPFRLYEYEFCGPP
jgi:hypothetical protein